MTGNIARAHSERKMARYLFVVSREHPELEEDLRERFADDPNVEVLRDRRRGPRRRHDVRVAVERRTGDRRTRAEIDEELRTRSHAIVTIPSESEITRALSWIEAGPRHLDVLRAMLMGHDRLRRAAETLTLEAEHLRGRLLATAQQSEQRGEEASRLRGEVEAHQHEREEILATLASLVEILNDLLSRLRGRTS